MYLCLVMAEDLEFTGIMIINMSHIFTNSSKYIKGVFKLNKLQRGRDLDMCQPI